jgi:hypothetical protein
MGLRVEQVLEELHVPCDATRVAMTFKIRFLGWVLTPKTISAQAIAPNPVAGWECSRLQTEGHKMACMSDHNRPNPWRGMAGTQGLDRGQGTRSLRIIPRTRTRRLFEC